MSHPRPPGGYVPNASERHIAALRAWLDARVNGRPVWLLAKVVAADLGVSSRVVGPCFAAMAAGDPVFKVEPWSYRNATRWRVERK